MTVKIRLARGGSKKKPYYRIVVANATAPRDGDFLEKVGTYNPLLTDDSTTKVTLKSDRVLYWLGCGAQPTERVAKFIAHAGIELPAKIQQKIAVRVKNYTTKPSKKDAKAAS